MTKRICQLRGGFKIIASTKMPSRKKLVHQKNHLWPVQNHIPQKRPCWFRACFEWFSWWFLMLICETIKSPSCFSTKICTKHRDFCNATWRRKGRWCSGLCTLKIHPVRLHIGAASLREANRWHSTDSSHAKVKQWQSFPLAHKVFKSLAGGKKSMLLVLPPPPWAQY